MSDYSPSVTVSDPVAGSKRSRVPSTKAVMAAATGGDVSPTDTTGAPTSASSAGANKKKKTGDAPAPVAAAADHAAAAGLALQPLVAAAANAALNQSKGGSTAVPRLAPMVPASSVAVALPSVSAVRTSSRAKTVRKPQLQDAMTDDDLDDDADDGDEDMQRAVAASTAAAAAAATTALPSVLTGAVTPSAAASSSAAAMFNPAAMSAMPFSMNFPFPPMPTTGAGAAGAAGSAAAAAAAAGAPMSPADQSAWMSLFQQQMRDMMAMTAGMSPDQVQMQTALAKRMQAVGVPGKKILKKDLQEEKQREFLSNAMQGVPPPLDFAAGVPQIKDPPKSLLRNACLLSSLPDDWQFKVYSFLSGSEVSTLSRTSKYFHTKTASPAVWKAICSQTMKYSCNHAAHPWKELFITRKLKLLDKFKPQPHRQYKTKHYFVCSCCQCIKGFQTMDDYNRHLELRHGPNRMRPPIPQKRPAKVDSATGMVLQRIGSVYPCPVMGCIKQFNKAIELKYHFDGVHKQSRAFPCDWPNCSKSFVSPAQLALHQCKHTGAPRPHQCTHPGCTKTFNTPSQVTKHMQSHLEKSQRTWLPCTVPGCTQTYATASAIKKHIATAHDPAQLKFRCSDPNLLGIFIGPGNQRDTITSTCHSAFFTKATWVDHLRHKHRIEPTHMQLMEVVRVVKGLPALPGMTLQQMQFQNQMMAMVAQQQVQAATQPSAAGGAPGAAAAGGPQSTQQLAANAVAQAMAAAAAGSVPPSFPLPTSGAGLAGLPPMSSMPFLMNMPGPGMASYANTPGAAAAVAAQMQQQAAAAAAAAAAQLPASSPSSQAAAGAAAQAAVAAAAQAAQAAGGAPSTPAGGASTLPALPV